MHETNSKQHSDVTNNELFPLFDKHDGKMDPPTRSAGEHQPAERSADRLHTVNYDRPNLRGVRQLYAVIDSVTDTIIGGIQLHLNDQSAIRTLYDVAMGDTMVHKHPLDFDLWRLGALGHDHTINPQKERIVTGHQIKALVDGPTDSK